MELKILRNFTKNEDKNIEQLITELSNTKGAKTVAKDIKKNGITEEKFTRKKKSVLFIGATIQERLERKVEI